MEKVVHMADEEMKHVVDLDSQTIENNKEIIKLYYGANDGWAPVKYMRELGDKIANVDAELDGNNIDHAFMLKDSERMGRKVGEWIIKYGNTNSN